MVYDVLIIGAGVIGCIVARELARYQLTIGVIEQSADVAGGTSKANSGIIHAGYDAPPNTLMARLNVTGARLMPQLCQELRVVLRQTGSLVVTENSVRGQAELDRLLGQGIANGVQELRIVQQDELRRLVPLLNPELEVGLYAPTAAVISPYQLTIALAENALVNGVHFLLNRRVTNIIKISAGLLVQCGTERYAARLVINAAGIQADQVAAMLSDCSFSITASKGQELILDKQYGSMTNVIIFPLPTETSKGIVVAPTVSGNLLIGPTSEPVVDKADTSTTREGQQQVLDAARQLVPTLSGKGVIAGYAGLRAVADTDDFVIRYSDLSPRLLHVAGTKSPGLSAAPAIAQLVRSLISERIELTPKRDFQPERQVLPSASELDPAEWHRLICSDAAYGRIICRCEQISEGEIRDALEGPLPPVTVDGLKRRLRVGMGRCQGGFCLPQLIELLSKYRNLTPLEVTKCGAGSEFLLGRNKAETAGGETDE